jgi:glc operon protein GlcG
MHSRPCLGVADVEKMIAACRSEVARNQWKVTIAVVDDAGFLLGLVRLDGASRNSAVIAVEKARTAALMRRPTKAIEDAVKDRPGFAKVPNVLPVQGGLPVLWEGECVGGIGVSGVQSHEDEAVAAAGIAVLGVP